MIFNLFKIKERIIYVNGEDTGVRENNLGAIYINPKIFLKNEKVLKILDQVKNFRK